MGVAKTASKEIFCYARNFFLTVKKCVQEVFARLGKKFYARSVHLEPAPGRPLLALLIYRPIYLFRKKKKRINMYFYTKNERFFDLYYYGLLEVGT